MRLTAAGVLACGGCLLLQRSQAFVLKTPHCLQNHRQRQQGHAVAPRGRPHMRMSSAQQQEQHQQGEADSTSSADSPPRRYRSVTRMEKGPRLPVWPAQNGFFFALLDLIGLQSLATWLEQTCGGRVCPMITSEGVQDASDPFVLLAHHRHAFYPLDPFRPISNLVIPEGFPRGFQTVTYVMDGGMVHRDSMGVKQEYGAGSVQWLDAGCGIMHEEMWATHPWKVSGIEIYQLWVNVPAKFKMEEPRILLLGEGTACALPAVTLPGGAQVVVIAGEAGAQAPQRTLARTPLSIFHVTVPPGAHFEHSLPPDHHCLIYVRKGTATVGTATVAAAEQSKAGQGAVDAVPTHAMAWLGGSGAAAVLLSNTDTRTPLDFLFLEGAPLREPRAAGGSFVMNTPSEISAAYEDYRRGFFGEPWEHTLSDEEWLEVVSRRRGSGPGIAERDTEDL